MKSDDDTPPPPHRTLRHDMLLPGRVATVGMWLFLIALGILFASGMLGYLIIRARHPELALRLPRILWLSTAIILAASLALHMAVRALRAERQTLFRRCLTAALLLSLAFLAVQAPALGTVLSRHQGLGADLYGFAFFLILLHALHVLGGLAALSRLTYKARHGDYDHEHYAPIRHAAMYWHFLDVVWLAMFAAL